MNWLFWVVAAFIAYHVIDGFCRGFIKKSVAALSLVITLAAVTWVTPTITTFIRENTGIRQSLQETCSQFFVDETDERESKVDQVQFIEGMNLPENIKEKLLENNNREAYGMLGVNDFREYVGAYLADLIIGAFSYFLGFVIVWTALRAIVLALDIVAALPLLHGINQLAGGVLGLMIAVVLVWVAFLFVGILCQGTLGQQFFALIKENSFLLFLYNQNIIMKLIFGLIF